jgi:DNA repair protein RecO (recombination protein O)
MSVFKTKGIVLLESNMGDNDKMLTILTPNGKIGCSAKGAKRPKSNLMAGTQYLCFGEFSLYKSASSYTINIAEPIEIFYNVRLDIDKLTYASKVTKLVNEVTDENQNTYRVLQLTLNTIYMFSESDKELDFIYSIFKMRLLSIIGFKPVIEGCSTCNEKKVSYFSLKDNGFKCEACGKQDKGAIKLSDTTIKAIRYIIRSDAKKIYSFDLSDENKAQLKMVAKLYLNKCLDKEFD